MFHVILCLCVQKPQHLRQIGVGEIEYRQQFPAAAEYLSAARVGVPVPLRVSLTASASVAAGVFSTEILDSTLHCTAEDL